jgi:iron complex transport system substrate-binding protein
MGGTDQMKKSTWKQLELIVLALVLAISLAGCGKKSNAGGELTTPAMLSSEATNSASATTAPAAAKQTKYPLTVKDATGKEFVFEKAPTRIVSVSPAETEALFAIGLNDQIVGVSDFDDYPEAAKSKKKMGGIVMPNTEAMIAANADLIITGVSMKAETVEKLRALNLNVFKVEPKKLDDAIADITLFGQITDHQEQAEKVVAKMKADRQKVLDAVKSVKQEAKKKVYVEFSAGWTVGSGEFMDELITLSGGVNVAADMKGWYQISEEKIIQQNPNVILFTKDAIDEKSKKTLDQIIRERSGWNESDAIKNNRVIGLDGNLISRPGPRLTDGLLEMAKGIYPELVK